MRTGVGADLIFKACSHVYFESCCRRNDCEQHFNLLAPVTAAMARTTNAPLGFSASTSVAAASCSLITASFGFHFKVSAWNVLQDEENKLTACLETDYMKNRTDSEDTAHTMTFSSLFH